MILHKLKNTLRKWINSSPGTFIEILRNSWRWNHIVIHSRRYTRLPEFIVLPLLCGKVKRKLSCPSNLTIILIHNYKRETILEKSLSYVGIDNYIVLRPENDIWPNNTIKIKILKEYIDSGDCSTEYVLYIDSDDAILRDDPGKVIQYLDEEKCELLTSHTHDLSQFKIMKKILPETARWAELLAHENGCENIFLNSGVFVARTSFMKEILNTAAEFVTEKKFSREERKLLKKLMLSHENPKELFPDFPKGYVSDQIIFRTIHPKFYPQVKIDFKERIAFR